MKNKKIILILVAVMLVLFVCPFSIWAASNAVTSLEGTDNCYVKEFDGETFATYRTGEKYVEPRLGKSGVSEHDYLFAGWYKDAACTIPYTSSAKAAENNCAYAKFVPKEIMQVKCMVSEGTNPDSETTNMRMISTVDSRYYLEMGFNVSYNGGQIIPCREFTGYARITASEGLQVGYTPKAFHNDAKYFFTHRLTGITDSGFDKFFNIQPYWITMDGTTVYGMERCVNVLDAYNKVVNLPIHLDSEGTVEAGTTKTLVLAYDKNRFESTDEVTSVAGNVFDNVIFENDADAGTITITASPAEETKLDGMLANIRLQLRDGALIESTTTFEVDNDIQVSPLSYKNFATSYAGTGDTSWYDEFKDKTNEFVVSSVADLQGLAALVNAGNDFEGKTIILGADVIGYTTSVISEGAIVGGQTPTAMTPIGTSTYKFNGTFDGGNNTISGLYVKSSGYCGLFGYCDSKSVIKNLKIENSYYTSSDHHIGGVAGVSQGGFDNIHIAKDVTIVLTDGKSYAGGIVGRWYTSKDMAIKNCVFEGNVEGKNYIAGITGYIDLDIESAIISNCIVNGEISFSGNQSGGVVGRIHNTNGNKDNHCTIMNCLIGTTLTTDKVEATKEGYLLGSATSTASLTIQNVYYSTDDNTWSGCGTDSLKTSNAIVTGAPEKLNVELTGTNAYKYTGLDFTSEDAKWVAVEGSLPQLKSFAEGTVIKDLSGVQRVDKGWYYNSFTYDENGTQKQDTFEVTTAEDMYGLADLVNTDSHTFEDETVRMGQNIVFNSVTGGESAKWSEGTGVPRISWTPIGTETAKFNGIFDGGSNTISGIYSSGAGYVGLFGWCGADSWIQNLEIKNSYYTSSAHYIGGVAGASYGGFDNIHIAEDVAIVLPNSKSYAGGIVGRWYTSKDMAIKNCVFEGNVKGNNYIAGITGYIDQNIESAIISNCIVNGEISFYGNQSGGVVGRICNMMNNQDNHCTIMNCLIGTTLNNTKTDGVETTKEGYLLGFANPKSGYVPANVTIQNVYYSTDDDTWSGCGTDSLNPSNAIITGSPQKLDDLTGANAYKYTGLDFTSENPVWVAIEGENPQLATFATGTPIQNLEANYKHERVDKDWYYNAITYVLDGETVKVANGTYTVTDEDDMYGFAALVNQDNDSVTFAGDIVEMGNDIVFNDAVAGDAEKWEEAWNAASENNTTPSTGEVPKRIWTPIGTSSSKIFQGTFEGHNHTISGIYLYRTTPNTGLFGTTKDSTLQNFKLKNSYYRSTIPANSSTKNSRMGSIVGYGDGTFSNILSEVIMYSNGNQNGGFIGYVRRDGDDSNTELNMSNCWYDGKLCVDLQYKGELYSGGFAGYVTYGTMEIDTCLFTGEMDIKTTSLEDDTSYARKVGAFCGSTNKNMTTRTIKNSWFGGSIRLNTSSEPKYIGTIIGIDQPTSTKVYTAGENVSVTTAITATYAGEEHSINGFGTNVENNIGTTVVTLDNEEVLIGKLAHVMTNLQFTGEGNVWAAREGTYPIPATLADPSEILPVIAEEKLDTEFETDSEDESIKYISTVGELFGLAKLSRTDNFAGTTFKLTADLNLNPNESASDWYENGTEATLPWYYTIGDASGNTDLSFAGTFDGCGHTISGIYRKTADRSYIGLFGCTAYGSMIKNLRMTNSYVHNMKGTGYRTVGSFAGNAYGNMEGLYSDAILVMAGTKTSVYSATGGIAGRVYADGAKANSSTITISDCWFTGDIYCTGVAKNAGGLIGEIRNGTVEISDSLFDGSLSCQFTEGDSYLGGICGRVYYDEFSVLELNSCVSAGNIIDANKQQGVGAVVGIVDSDEEAATLTMNNVFAGRESGAIDANQKSNTIKTGNAIWVNNQDRLMAYCKQATVSEVTPQLTPEKWLTRVSGVPVPSCFSDMLGTDAVDTATLDSGIGLNTTGIELQLANAVNTGLGNYTLTKEAVTPDTIASYTSALTDSLGFEKLSENGDYTNGVYGASLVKDTGNWVIHITYSSYNQELHVTINTQGRTSLSPQLDANNVQVVSGNTRLTMLQTNGSSQGFDQEEVVYTPYYYGNSFVFTLPEAGHYIICDGGNKDDLTGLLEFVTGTTASDGNVYIDAWIVSHQHADHFDVIKNIYSNPELISNIYVNAFYMNEVDAAVVAAEAKNYSVNMELKSNGQYRAMDLFQTSPEGVTTPIYRMYTGQKYYFNGLTMDVILTHDVMDVTCQTLNKPLVANRSSAIVLFTTTNGEKVFIGGDADYVNMRCIIDMYGQDETGYTKSALLQDIDIFVALHHGKYSSYAPTAQLGDNTFVDYLTTEERKFQYVLYPCSIQMGVDSTASNAFKNVGSVNQHMNERSVYGGFDFEKGNVTIDLDAQ